MVIRRAFLEDAQQITSIKTETFRDEKTRFAPPPDKKPSWFDNEWYADNEETKRLIQEFYSCIILVNEEMIGCFWLHDVDAETVELEDFCIRPAFQGRGYGSLALQEMEKLFPNKKRWILGTPFYSVRNHHLYEKAGYTKVGEAAEGTVYLYEKMTNR